MKEKINTKRTGHNTYKERGQIKTNRWDKNILEALLQINNSWRAIHDRWRTWPFR
jgi:16S rRNA U1498 N3-methylase RsmE